MAASVAVYDAYPNLVVRDGTHNRAANVIARADGTYLCVYQSGPAENGGTSIKFRSSTDGIAYDDVIGSFDEISSGYDVKGGNVLELASGTLICTYNRTEFDDPDVTRVGVFMRTSTDGGVTWSAASEIETSYSDAAIGGPAVLLSNGDIIQPCWASSGGAIDSFFLKSTDSGATWGGETMIADGSADGGLTYYEPCVIVMANGTWLCLIREGNQDKIRQTFSTDSGATWLPTTVAFAGQSASRVIQLASGKLFTVFRRETGAGEAQYRTSDDNANTWNSAVYLLQDSHNMTYGGAIEVGSQTIAISGIKWSDTDGAIDVFPLTTASLT